jgi:drug/metabolite transporter (DMT)-like permease
VHKTLLVWVALLAVPLLGERIGALQVAAIALLVLGQIGLAGCHDSLRPGPADGAGGDPAVDGRGGHRQGAARRSVIVDRGLHPDGHRIGRPDWLDGGTLVALTGKQWMWVLVTGVILAGYVATWFAALSRAPALDVTAVLVIGAVITALLAAAVNGKPLAPQLGWPALVLVGAILGAVPTWRGRQALGDA